MLYLKYSYIVSMSASHDLIFVLIISLKRLDEHLKVYREQYGAVLAFRPTGEFLLLCKGFWNMKSKGGSEELVLLLRFQVGLTLRR